MKDAVYGFLLALQFLTRIPVKADCPWNERTSRWAIRFYPVVGAVVAGLLAGVAWLGEPHLPAIVLTMLIISLWVWLTGGLHLDGLMDVADAAGSNAPLEKKWQIMKDPHVGSFGIIALFFLLGWKTVFVYLIIDEGGALAFGVLVLIMMLARLAAVCLLVFLPAAKKEGLAWHWKKNISTGDALLAGLPAAAAAIVFASFWPVVSLFIAGGLIFGWWIMRTFKGVNGDMAGTAIEGGELWGLMLVWIFIWSGTG